MLPNDAWLAIRGPVIAAFDGSAQSALAAPDARSADALRILRTKLTGLNEKSSNMKYDEFFEALGLAVGDVERVALRERNMPAHGAKYSAEKYPALLSRVRALETLFNRCVLKLAGGADTYIDYSTLGHPDRALAQALGGPLGDGKSA